MATTTNGWPYVEPGDHPLEYPPLSQQLAQLLDTTITPLKETTSGITAYGAGWGDAGGTDGPAILVRQGRMVTVNAMMKRTSDLTTVTNTPYEVCTMPQGFRPQLRVNLTGIYVQNQSAGVSPTRVTIVPGGVCYVYFSTAFTLTSGQFIAVTGAFITP